MSHPTAHVPATCKALVEVQEGQNIALEEVPVPELGENEVLIKVKAVCLNPGDLRALRMYPANGAFVGSDLSGEVVKLGPNLQNDIRVGDVVGASVTGGVESGRGAFAEYAKAYSDIVWKVPEGTYSFEEVAATGVPLNTAFQGLYGSRSLKLAQPFGPTAVQGETWIFIYGGSTSVGLYMIQLAKLSGYKVVTVASPRNHDLLKSYGADAVFDYRDSDMIQKVKAATGDTIQVVIDTVSEKETQFTAIKALAEGAPGRLLVILPLVEGISDIRSDVQVMFMIVYSAYGFQYGPYGLNDDDRRELAAFLQKVPGLVREGKLKPAPVKKLGGGLEHVFSDGYKYLADGKVSAERVVFAL